MKGEKETERERGDAAAVLVLKQQSHLYWRLIYLHVTEEGLTSLTSIHLCKGPGSAQRPRTDEKMVEVIVLTLVSLVEILPGWLISKGKSAQLLFWFLNINTGYWKQIRKPAAEPV